MGNLSGRKRQSGIELLRILAAMGVVVLHYNNESMGGGLRFAIPGSGNQFLLYFLESLNIAAVNIFILINGYFDVLSDERDLLKPVKLIVQVIVFNICFYLAGIALGRTPFTVRNLLVNLLPLNWFIILYAALYLISPFLNLGIRKLSLTQLRRMVILLLMLFSIWPTFVDLVKCVTGAELMGLSTIGMLGSQGGYTIVNFVLVYIVGAYLRLSDLKQKSGRLLGMLLGNTILITVWAYSKIQFNLSSINAYDYCNPLVILNAVFIFLLFRNMKFRCALINFLSRASLCVYLIHGYFISHLQIEKVIRLNQPLITIMHLVICCLGLYLIGVLINFLYSAVTQPVYREIDRRWKRHRKYLINSTAIK